MADSFASGLMIPVMFLALIAWLVPKLLSMIMPEGVKPLMALSFISTVILLIVAAAVFMGLYLVQGATLATFFAPGVADSLLFLLRLSVSAGIIWGPIMVLSIAGLPRTWTTEEW